MLPADVASDVASDDMMADAASFPSNDIGSRPRFLRGGPNANENVINDPLLPYSLERSCQFDPYPVALTRTQSDVTKALKLGQFYDITLHEHVVRFATINSSGQNSTAWAQGTVFGQSPDQAILRSSLPGSACLPVFEHASAMFDHACTSVHMHAGHLIDSFGGWSM